MFKLISYIRLTIISFLIYFANGYLIKTNGKHKIISVKPEMKRYCTNNNLYSSYDRINCLKTLSDQKINWSNIDYNNKLANEEHELAYQKYKFEKEKVNNKIKELNILYTIHQI